MVSEISENDGNAVSWSGKNKNAWTSIIKRPRRSAVLLLCTPSWSIPRSPVAQNYLLGVA